MADVVIGTNKDKIKSLYFHPNQLEIAKKSVLQNNKGQIVPESGRIFESDLINMIAFCHWRHTGFECV